MGQETEKARPRAVECEFCGHYYIQPCTAATQAGCLNVKRAAPKTGFSEQISGESSMVTVADIQKDLPNWPDAVIDPWLIEFANDPGMGWPPREPYGNHRWGLLFGQRPLSWWQNVTWTLEKTNCGLTQLTPKARADAMDIRNEVSSGAPRASTKRRWDNIFRYILNTGTFPVAPIVMRRPEGLSPIDGTHRLAVFSALQLMPQEKFASLKVEKPALEQDVWVGVHKDGELPNAQ